MTGSAYRCNVQPPVADPQNIEAVYAVYPLAKYSGGETAYVFVSSSPAVGDTCIYPCNSAGHPLGLELIGCEIVLDHAKALRAAGWEFEEVTPRVA